MGDYSSLKFLEGLYKAQRDLERLLDPMRGLQKAAESLRATGLSSLSQQTQWLDPLRDSGRAAEAFATLGKVSLFQPISQQTSFLAGLDFNAHVSRISSIQRELDSLAGPLRLASQNGELGKVMAGYGFKEPFGHKSLREDLERWQRLLPATRNSSLRASAFGWSESVSRVAAAAAQSLLTSSITERLLAPAHAFTSFAGRTTALAQSADKGSRLRLDFSVQLAETQLATNSMLLGRVLDGFKASETSAVMPRRQHLGLFGRQQGELLEAEISDPEDLSAMVRASDAATIGALAAETMRLVAECNRAWRLKGHGEDIFKVTNRLLIAYAELPFTDVTTELLLGQFVDNLYVTVYESAGDKNLRFLKEHGGPLAREETAVAVVFHLKHVRNKLLRHDPEHGSDRDVDESYRLLGEALRFFSFDHLPKRVDELRVIERNMLGAVRVFLSRLHEAITS